MVILAHLNTSNVLATQSILGKYSGLWGRLLRSELPQSLNKGILRIGALTNYLGLNPAHGLMTLQFIPLLGGILARQHPDYGSVFFATGAALSATFISAAFVSGMEIATLSRTKDRENRTTGFLGNALRESLSVPSLNQRPRCTELMAEISPSQPLP